MRGREKGRGSDVTMFWCCEPVRTLGLSGTTLYDNLRSKTT